MILHCLTHFGNHRTIFYYEVPEDSQVFQQIYASLFFSFPEIFSPTILQLPNHPCQAMQEAAIVVLLQLLPSVQASDSTFWATPCPIVV